MGVFFLLVSQDWAKITPKIMMNAILLKNFVEKSMGLKV